jgi:hypothetical protein
MRVAGPVFTHSLHGHCGSQYMRCDFFVQKSVPEGNLLYRHAEQYVVCPLQLANRLGISKSYVNEFDTQSCLDVNTSFVICHSLLNRHYSVS